MLVKTLFLFAVIAMCFVTPAFAESIPMKIKDVAAQVNFALSYTTTGMQVNSLTGDTDIISVIFGVTVTEPTGDITIKIPRNIFDAKMNNEDDEFFILADGDEIQFEEEKDDDNRIISISVMQGTEEIEIFGTKLLNESFIEKMKESAEKEEALTQEKFEQMQRDALLKHFEEQQEQQEQQEYVAAQKIQDEIDKEDARIAFLKASCGEGTVYEEGVGCVALEEESIDSGPLINSIFAAMGIGLAVMIILWGIGKRRGHKKLSDGKSDDS
jgi:hypothetical protein